MSRDKDLSQRLPKQCGHMRMWCQHTALAGAQPAPPQGPARANGMPCTGAIPHSAAPALRQAQRGSLGVTAWPLPTRSTLTLVEEDIACIKGDTGEDIVGGTGVALVHPLDFHVQPAGRAEPC